MKKTLLALLVLASLQTNAQEGDSYDIEKVTVSGRQVSLVGARFRETANYAQWYFATNENALRAISANMF